MKLIKLVFFLLITMSLSFGAITVHAANKSQQQQTAKQKKAEKKQVKNNKNFYKKIKKPVLNKQKAQNKVERKQAKAAIKNNKKAFKKATGEANKFYKLRMASKNALLKQGGKLVAAQEKAKLNPTQKNLKAKIDLETRYNKAFKDYQEGPKKRWQNKVNATQTARNNLDASKTNYNQKKTEQAKINMSKIKAKAAIKKTSTVSNGLYNTNPVISSLSIRDVPPPLSTRGTSIAGSNSTSSTSKLPIYDKVPPRQILNYAPANSPLVF